MDDAVLIIGAGPIGLAVATWARHFGLTHVVVSEMNPKRLALAEKMGATATISAAQEPDVIAAYQRHTGRRPSVIFEAVGIPGMIQRCIEMAEPDSRIVVVGVCQETDSFEPMQCIFKTLQLIFVLGYTVADYATILTLLEQGRISVDPLISHRITLEELPEVFEKMRRPTDQMKVIVEPDRHD
jgi:(R,R)-butanediol dehydrogenase/meso-butanediol dehydrogenase/diacetyl reductase